MYPSDLLPDWDFDDSISPSEEIWWGWMYPAMAAVWFYGYYYGRPDLCERVEALPRYDVHPSQYERYMTPEDWGPLAANLFEQLVYAHNR